MHTPGPWAEDEKHTGGARAIIGDGQQLVALVYGKTIEEQSANAKLIAAAQAEKCEWVADGEDSWNTGCKKHFYFTDGDPADNGFEHCPFCGGWLFISNEPDS